MCACGYCDNELMYMLGNMSVCIYRDSDVVAR